jgi:hypothetical protein
MKDMNIGVLIFGVILWTIVAFMLSQIIKFGLLIFFGSAALILIVISANLQSKGHSLKCAIRGAFIRFLDFGTF